MDRVWKMMHGILFLLYISQQTLEVSTLDVVIVSKCPCRQSEWIKQEEKMGCNGKQFTCIETINGSLIECCILPYKFKQSDGCPYVETITPNDGPLIAVKHTECTVSGCPSKDHDEYSINEMYKYPACLIPLRRRQEIRSHTDIDQLCSIPHVTEDKITSNNTHIYPFEEKDTPTATYVLLCFVTLCFSVATFLFVFVYFRRKYDCTRKNLEGGDPSRREYINYANGLAWSHYTGFLCKLLPGLENAIKNSRTFKENPDRTITSWIMLCPKSGMSSCFTEDPNITIVESITVPGIKPQIDIYRIQKDKLEKPWFCCFEYPSALMSIAKERDILTQETISLEVKRFSFYIMNLLNHERNNDCKDKAMTIFYDDENMDSGGSISSVVLNRLQFLGHPNEDELPNVCLLHAGKAKGRGKYFDFESAVSSRSRPSILDLRRDDKRIIAKVIKQSRWIVLYDIVEEISTKHQWLMKCIENEVKEETGDIIVVFSGKSQEKEVKSIPWTVAIDVEKELYAAEKVKKIINDENVVLSSDIVIGDLSYGLTWAFFVNYLQHVTKDLSARMENGVKENTSVNGKDNEIITSKYFWQIIPTNCVCVSLNELDEKISVPIPLKPLKTTLFGAQRVFPSSLYSIKHLNAVYHFVGEVFSPCKVLKAMEKSNLVSLSDRDISKQASQLNTQMNKLLETFEGKEHSGMKVKVLLYNDRKKKLLSEVLAASIATEENKANGVELEHPCYPHGSKEETISMLKLGSK